jgi:glyoxylase I family protein
MQPWRPTSTDDAVVRYQIVDLDHSIDFYTSRLGFTLTQRAGPVAIVSRGALHLILSAPDSSGSRTVVDGRRQEPGGWNRIVLYFNDLDEMVDRLRGAGVTFLNDMMVGPGGKQIQIADPDGNSVELHEAPT